MTDSDGPDTTIEFWARVKETDSMYRVGELDLDEEALLDYSDGVAGLLVTFLRAGAEAINLTARPRR